MDDSIEVQRDPDPGQSLLLALAGPLEPAGAVSMAATAILDACPAERLAVFDSDCYFDYRTQRGLTRLSDGRADAVLLPGLTVFQATDQDGKQLLVLAGQEPSFSWRRLTRALTELLDRWQVRQVVALDALPWPAPHTRPVVVGAYSTNPLVSARFPLLASIAELPATLPALLAAGGHGHFDVTTLVAHVPQYVAALPYAPAAEGLLDAAGAACGLNFSGLLSEAGAVESDLNVRMRTSPALASLVGSLEALHDEQLRIRRALPTGDALASQIEAYLQDLS